MCLFCKICDKEIPSKIILEDDDFLCFEDIAPKSKIHLLVIPKKHFDSFEEVTPDIMSKFTSFVQQLTKQLDISKNGYRLITNIGDDGCQEVKHLHFHLLAGEKLKGF
jgi:histidine triad (HIT) family protein